MCGASATAIPECNKHQLKHIACGNDVNSDNASQTHTQPTNTTMEGFLALVQSGQHEAVRDALKSSAPDIDYQDPGREGNTALHLAVTAKHNKTRLIELLLEAGADCELRNHADLTPAELALESGSQFVAEFILGKELHGVPDEQALRRLIRRGSVELLRIFIEKRAFDIHTKMKLIARALDELTVKGVAVDQSMRVFLEYELIAHSYDEAGGHWSGGQRRAASSKRKADGKVQSHTDGGATETERRVELVLSYTKYLCDRYDDDNLNDLDDEFVVRLRAICESLYCLEGAATLGSKQLKTIPLAELTYLCGVLLSMLEKSVGFEIYKLVLNKNAIVAFLRAVSEELAVALVRPDPDRSARSFQWTPQLLLDLIACIREQKLSQYIVRRRRVSEDLRRIAAATDTALQPADHELIVAELGRRELAALQDGVLERDAKWGVADYVAYLRDDHPLTVGQLWQRYHPKLRLSKRQVAYAASRRELLTKIRARRLAELSRNKTKLLEKELTARELQGAGGGGGGGGPRVRRRNRIVFCHIRRTYDQIRQMHTVKRIAYYVENALVIDLDDRSNATLCLMAIQRVLQYIGEASTQDQHQPRAGTFGRTLANMLDHVLGPLASTAAPCDAPDLRDSFSARCTVGKYFINKALTGEQVRMMQERLRAVYRFCLYVINIQLIEAYKTFLGTAYRLRNLEQLRSYARYVGEHNLHTLSHIKFEHVFYDEKETGRIVHELKKMYVGMSNELKLLSFIEKNIHFRFYHMQYHQTRLRVTLSNFAVVYRALRANADYACVRRLLHSYLHQSYQKYDISRSISISDANLALKELLRPYSSISENEDTLKVVSHLEELQSLMDPDRLFGINPVRSVRVAGASDATRYQQFTRKLLKELNAPSLNDEELAQLHEKLSRAYYGNVFSLHSRNNALDEFFRARGVALPETDLIVRRERDEEVLQELFDSKVNDLVEILEKFECTDPHHLAGVLGELPPVVQFALEYGVRELLEILASVNAIGPSDRWQRCETTAVLSGRTLKTFLAGGREALVLESLTIKSNATIFLNAIVFKHRSFQLYGGAEGERRSNGEPTVPRSGSCFAEKFANRLQWVDQQRSFFEAIARADEIELSTLRRHVRDGVVEIAGKRLGSLMPNEMCHYGLIDCVIAGDFRAMIDLLTGEPAASSNVHRRRLLQYLVRRTSKSHFMVAPLEQMSDEDRRTLVLYLCMFHGDVELFRKHLDRYDAYDDLQLFVNSEDHRFVERLLSELHDRFDWSRTDANGMTVLQKLVNAGNLPAVRNLTARMSPEQLNSLCSMKYSALNLAARLNLLEMVRVLTEAKVNVNVMSEDEKLPVFWLIQYGNPRTVVQQAIDDATELTAFSSELCLLHRAIEYGNEDVLRYLIEDCKVDPTRIYSNCNNVLHVAAGFDRSRIAHYLLTIPGVRKIVNNCNLVKNSALNVACKEGHIRTASILLESGGASTDSCGEYGLNALAFAMYTNNAKLVRLLFRHGASVSNPLSSDFQPMNMAIRNRNIRMLELLLRRGVDVNSAPLCFINAVYAQSRDIVRLLIARGVRHVNHRDEFCQTALHLCVEKDEYEMARDLIRFGAHINAKNRSGMTPLHLAVQWGNVRLVQLLLDSKCSVDELNYHGETPLIRAVVGNNLALVKILLNNGASIERLRNSDPPVLLYLVQENHEEILDYLLEHYQFNANEQDAYGNSLLYVATQHNHINIVKLLVDKYHAKTNPANHKKLTPLMIARVKEYKEIFHFLEARLVEE
uniref:Ankyrin repeat protein n=1 Tax=Anopheles dirus TaxID=7168 RepID=A0A182NED9_9DIPT